MLTSDVLCFCVIISSITFIFIFIVWFVNNFEKN